jgi:hypothetical protein
MQAEVAGSVRYGRVPLFPFVTQRAVELRQSAVKRRKLRTQRDVHHRDSVSGGGLERWASRSGIDRSNINSSAMTQSKCTWGGCHGGCWRNGGSTRLGRGSGSLRGGGSGTTAKECRSRGSCRGSSGEGRRRSGPVANEVKRANNAICYTISNAQR